MRGIEISTDNSRLNLNFIATYLQATYWANKRSTENIKISIDNSLCFGVYLHGSQIGFARVVTDKTVFAYLMESRIDLPMEVESIFDDTSAVIRDALKKSHSLHPYKTDICKTAFEFCAASRSR